MVIYKVIKFFFWCQCQNIRYWYKGVCIVRDLSIVWVVRGLRAKGDLETVISGTKAMFILRDSEFIKFIDLPRPYKRH